MNMLLNYDIIIELFYFLLFLRSREWNVTAEKWKVPRKKRYLKTDISMTSERKHLRINRGTWESYECWQRTYIESRRVPNPNPSNFPVGYWEHVRQSLQYSRQSNSKLVQRERKMLKISTESGNSVQQSVCFKKIPSCLAITITFSAFAFNLLREKRSLSFIQHTARFGQEYYIKSHKIYNGETFRARFRSARNSARHYYIRSYKVYIQARRIAKEHHVHGEANNSRGRNMIEADASAGGYTRARACFSRFAYTCLRIYTCVGVTLSRM